MEDLEELLGERLVDLVVAADEDALRAELVALAEGHAGADAVRARLVGAGRGHAALVGQAADDDRLALERRVEEDLDGREERVDVDVDDVAAVQRHDAHAFRRVVAAAFRLRNASLQGCDYKLNISSAPR